MGGVAKKRRGYTTLFFRVTAIVVIALAVTNVLTVTLSMKVTERLFSESFTMRNQTIMDETMDNLAQLNLNVMEMVGVSRQNTALQRYLTTNSAQESDRYQMIYRVTNSFTQLRQSGNYINTTSFLGSNGILYSLGNYGAIPMSTEQVTAHAFTVVSEAEPDKLHYFYCNTRFLDNAEGESVLVASKQLISQVNAKPFGTIFVTIPESVFHATYSSSVVQGSDVLVLDRSGQVISGNNKEALGRTDHVLLDFAMSIVESGDAHRTVVYNGDNVMMVARYLPVYDMYLVNLVTRDIVLQDYFKLQPVVFGICLIAVIGGTLAAFMVTRRISRPLTTLVRSMEQSKDGNFMKTELTGGGYEVDELQNRYNSMVEEIENYLTELVQEQEERRKAEIEALQMQINPHFLYNTLASIKYLVWQNQSADATEMINALISLLRNTIGKTDEVIPLSEEFENIKSYVTINRLRYGEDIAVLNYADEDCMDCLLPKMIIQPFIENAYFHAFQTKQKGFIRIFFHRKGSYLICQVIDDGDGIPANKQEDLYRMRKSGKNFSGIGISNVDQRLKLIYGEECGVSVVSTMGIGTTITITMNYTKKDACSIFGE